MYPDWDMGTASDQKPVWEALSAQYAEGATGKVTYVHTMKDGQPYYGGDRKTRDLEVVHK